LPPPSDGAPPGFGPSQNLDYELEVGCFIAKGNRLGSPVPIAVAEDQIFGLCLVNDWSARDIQRWEYQPLGPFLAKSFATTISPWVVTWEALQPFRCAAFVRPEGDPQPLPYLQHPDNAAFGGIQLELEVLIQTEHMRSATIPPHRLSRGDFAGMYWTFAQMIAHHTSNGCNLQPGDLLASGTVSGRERDARGCLLELTWSGEYGRGAAGSQRTGLTLPSGEQRIFLQDGDEVTLRGRASAEGYRSIGFGECRGRIVAHRSQ
jgi:fumarylacetoacetase